MDLVGWFSFGQADSEFFEFCKFTTLKSALTSNNNYL